MFQHLATGFPEPLRAAGFFPAFLVIPLLNHSLQRTSPACPNSCRAPGLLLPIRPAPWFAKALRAQPCCRNGGEYSSNILERLGTNTIRSLSATVLGLGVNPRSLESYSGLQILLRIL